MIMKITTFMLLFAVVLSAYASVVTPAPTAIPTQDPKALAAELDAIAEKLFGNGK
jgi:hypothetical protein